MERIYKIESVLRKSNTIIIIQGNYDRIYNYFNHNNGWWAIFEIHQIERYCSRRSDKKNLDKCDFLRTFCCFPIFSQRFVDRLSHILNSSLFSIPPIIANRCLKDFYIARDTKDTYEWFISEKLKNILIKEKIRYEIGESGKTKQSRKNAGKILVEHRH